MALTFPANGTQLTTALEVEFFSQVISTAMHGLKVHLDTMTGTETFVIKIYNYDNVDAVERLFGTFTYTGVQTEATTIFDFIPSTRYRATIQKTAGTDRTVSWERMVIA